MSSEAEQKLLAWISERNGGLPVLPSSNLMKEKLINSLQFVSFLMYIEELRGAPVEEAEVRLDSFSSVATIVGKFFPASHN
jgi:hypothetical protein